MNFTNVVFSLKEIRLLSHGPKFYLPKPFNELDEYINMQSFMRKLNLKEYFKNQEDNYNSQYFIPGKSTFNPSSSSNTLFSHLNKVSPNVSLVKAASCKHQYIPK